MNPDTRTGVTYFRGMRRKLTTKTIDALPPATLKRYEIRDDTVRGLHIRVSVNGSKVWYVATRVGGIARRIKLGTYPILSLADARQKATKLLRDVQLGNYVDPKKRPATSERVPTLGEVIPQFIMLYAKPRNRDWKGAQSILRKFAALNALEINAIRRVHVVRVLDEIVASGTPYRANRALAALKRLMSWCVERGTLDVNPISGLRPPTKEESRDRVLSDDELVACWMSADLEGYPFSECIKLLILTGQRRTEVSDMRWSEVDLEAGVWVIPARRAKNATQHAVPLSPVAVQLLEAIPRFEGSDLVFTTNGSRSISGFGRLKRRLDTGVSAADWRIHDIRRTVATNMAMTGTAPHIIEAVLNHKSGVVSGVAAIYNRHAYLDEKRTALLNWSSHLARMVDGRTLPQISQSRVASGSAVASEWARSTA